MTEALKQIWDKVDRMMGPQRMETEAERDRLAAAIAVLEAKVAGLVAYLDTIPDGPVSAEVIDAICALAHGRTDHPVVRAAWNRRAPPAAPGPLDPRRRG